MINSKSTLAKKERVSWPRVKRLKCKIGGQSVCLDNKLKCDGVAHCDDKDDEATCPCPLYKFYWNG